MYTNKQTNDGISERTNITAICHQQVNLSHKRRGSFQGREAKFEYVPSRTRRVDSTSLTSTLPSLASFKASTARWAPPSAEKRMKPYKERGRRCR